MQTARAVRRDSSVTYPTGVELMLEMEIRVQFMPATWLQRATPGIRSVSNITLSGLRLCTITRTSYDTRRTCTYVRSTRDRLFGRIHTITKSTHSRIGPAVLEQIINCSTGFSYSAYFRYTTLKKSCRYLTELHLSAVPSTVLAFPTAIFHILISRLHRPSVS